MAILVAGLFSTVRMVTLSDHASDRSKCLDNSLRNREHKLIRIVVELLAVFLQALDAMLEAHHLFDNEININVCFSDEGSELVLVIKNLSCVEHRHWQLFQ